MKISIIIVYYKNKNDLIECLNSFYKFKPKLKFEVIVVDNSETLDIEKDLKKYKNLKYISSVKNVGYGGGINLGVLHSSGKYLFVLNQDVIFNQDIVSGLVKTLDNNPKVGIVSPILYSSNGKVMDQGAKELTPLRAIFKLSFIGKLFPNNPISKDYWIKIWQKNKLKEVDNVPGTALMVRKNVFEEVGGFDRNFFLYFEEFDLCKRIRALGYKIYIDPDLMLIHKWGTSTKSVSNINDIFKKSRFYYFKKHFGLPKALLVEAFISINSKSIIFLLILLTALLVRLYQISVSIPLIIGDQGWFYLSARDLLLFHSIPLVGITSSHIWLHQGPLWTYILAIIFFVSKFNPLAPVIFTIFLDGVTLILIYKVVGKIFSWKAALFACLIYAFSPYVILASRMPYHTSLIPILMILLVYSLYKWFKGHGFYFPITILLISLLYNFELQTSLLYILIFLFLFYGFIKKPLWFKRLLNKKIFFMSVAAFTIPMFPILIYDIYHGFPQTIIFAGWIFYKGLSFIISLFTGAENNSKGEITTFLVYFYSFFQKLIFTKSVIFSFIVILFSAVYLIYKNTLGYLQKKDILRYFILLILNIFLFGGILISKTPSDAYLYSLIIPFIILVSVFFGALSRNKKTFLVILLIVVISALVNVYTVFGTSYFKSNSYYPNRLTAARYMVKDSKGSSFRIVGVGSGSQFESFTANYEYLSWYLGGNPKKTGEIIYILYETPNGTKIIRKN